MKNLFLGLTAAALLAFTSCGSPSEPAANEEVATETLATDDHQTSVPQKQFNELFDQYKQVTTALSSDDSTKASHAAAAVLEVILQNDLSQLSEAEQKNMEPMLESMRMRAEGISKANDIAEQRVHLEELSKNIYAMAKTFGTDHTVYKIYCSMYDNDRGAYWLSDSKEIKNPYFGASMFSCGEVQEELN